MSFSTGTFLFGVPVLLCFCGEISGGPAGGVDIFAEIVYSGASRKTSLSEVLFYEAQGIF